MQDIVFEETLRRWDMGVPLGNGDIGCLVWGTPKKLRFSLDKGDIWDLSDKNEQDENFTYNFLGECIKNNNTKDMDRVFEKSYINPTPTKLPIGAIELNFHTNSNIKTVWSLKEAKANLYFNDTSIETRIYSDVNMGVVNIFNGEYDLKIENPKFGSLPIKWWQKKSKKGITQSLKNLHYKKPSFIEKTVNDITFYSFNQEVNDSLNYSIVLGVKKEKIQSKIVFTVAKNEAVEHTVQKIIKFFNSEENDFLIKHHNWWESYWKLSEIIIPNQELQKGWNIANYLLGAGSRKNKYPIPLQGLWTADNGQIPPWKGDYHHDLNTQLTYFSYAKANRLEQGECFIDFLLNLEEQGIKFAKSFYKSEGLCLPSVMDIEGGALGGWAMYSLSPTNMLWLCDIMAKHYRFTLDKKYLERCYAYFLKVEKLFNAILKERDGKLYLQWSSSPEIHDNKMAAFLEPNSNYDLSLMINFYKILTDFAKINNDVVNEKKFLSKLSKFDDLAVNKDGVLMLCKTESLTESHRHFSHAMSIFPLRILDYDNENDKKIIDATIKNLEELGSQKWTGYSFAWLAEMFTVQRNGNKAEKILEIFYNYFCFDNGFHVNGDYKKQGFSTFSYTPFTLEGNFCAADAIQEMLLFSNKDIIEPLRAIPDSWKNLSFNNLRGENGILVSLKLTDGIIEYLSLCAAENTAVILINKFSAPMECNIAYNEGKNHFRLELKKGIKAEFKIIR